MIGLGDSVKCMVEYLPEWELLSVPHEYYAVIKHTAGCEVGVFADRYRKRITMSVSYPRHVGDTGGCARSWSIVDYQESPRDQIGMSITRTPEKLAQGFRSRLEARAIEIYTLVLPRYNAELIEDDHIEKLLGRLLGDQRSKDHNGWQGSHRGRVYGPEGPNWERWNAAIQVVEIDRVDLELRRLTGAQALAVMGVLQKGDNGVGKASEGT